MRRSVATLALSVFIACRLRAAAVPGLGHAPRRATSPGNWSHMRIGASRRQDSEPHGAAVERPGIPERTCNPRVKEHVTRLVVEVNRANAWRGAAVEAERAFEWWKNAAPADRREAAAIYLAGIEREEKAADEYRRALEAFRTTAS